MRRQQLLTGGGTHHREAHAPSVFPTSGDAFLHTLGKAAGSNRANLGEPLVGNLHTVQLKCLPTFANQNVTLGCTGLAKMELQQDCTMMAVSHV